MSLPQRVEGIYQNYLLKQDETKVISDILYPKPPRFEPQAETPETVASTWGKMDLSHIFGFPAWEESVFNSIASTYDELVSVFTFYAKSGTAGATSADAAMTIQSTELGNLALDIGVLSEKFNMTRVINIFRRADQVDDNVTKSKSDHRVETGEEAKAGDRGLEIHGT